MRHRLILASGLLSSLMLGVDPAAAAIKLSARIRCTRAKGIQQVFVWFDHRVARDVGTNKRVANADVRTLDANHNFDCWDTTRNAASSLLVLQDWGLLRHHRVSDPRYRGDVLVGQLPHNTAVIKETAAGGTSWVVDMWPTAFGQVPDVMTLDKWLDEI